MNIIWYTTLAGSGCLSFLCFCSYEFIFNIWKEAGCLVIKHDYTTLCYVLWHCGTKNNDSFINLICCFSFVFVLLLWLRNIISCHSSNFTLDLVRRYILISTLPPPPPLPPHDTWGWWQCSVNLSLSFRCPPQHTHGVTILDKNTQIWLICSFCSTLTDKMSEFPLWFNF